MCLESDLIQIHSIEKELNACMELYINGAPHVCMKSIAQCFTLLKFLLLLLAWRSNAFMFFLVETLVQTLERLSEVSAQVVVPAPPLPGYPSTHVQNPKLRFAGLWQQCLVDDQARAWR